MKNPMEINQICCWIYLTAICRRICLVAIARSNLNGLRLKWVCVEVKFFGLFMEFFGLLSFPLKKGAKEENLIGEERWEKEEKE